MPEVLAARARAEPERRVFTFLEPGGAELSLTYGELDRAARAIAARLRRAGAAGERALLLYPPGLDYVASLYGCLYAGVVAVPAYMPDPARLARSIAHLRGIAADAQVGFALTPPQFLELRESLFPDTTTALGTMEWIAADRHEPGAASGVEHDAQGASGLAYLQYTSGSTRTPRGVMIDHQTLVAHLQAMDHALDLQGAVISLWVPPYHDMGLVGGIIGPVYWGGRSVLMSPADFVVRPHAWLEAVCRHRAAYTSAPNFGFELAVRKTTPEQQKALDLTCLKAAICGAEPARAVTLRRFVDTFSSCGLPSGAVRPAYGLAEATLLVSAGRFDRSDGDGPVALGAPLAGHSVRVVDPDTGVPRADGEVGEIWVSGPSVARRYWNKPEETRLLLERCLQDEPGRRYARTGDLGTIRDGQVHVTSRLKDLIVVAGRNVYPQDLELSVENAHSLVRPGCVAAFSVDGEASEEVVIVAEVADAPGTDADALVAAIRHAVREEHELDPSAVVLIAPRTLPKTSSGKLQRGQCRTHYLNGRLETVGWWSRREALSRVGPRDLRDRLAKIVGTVLNAHEIGLDTSLRTLDLCSLDALRIGNALEQEFGSRPAMTDILREATLRSLARFYKQSSAPAPARAVPLVAAGRDRRLPLSYAQGRLWLLDELMPDNPVYSLPFALRLRGTLDRLALERALGEIVARHEALRTTFPVRHGEPHQQIAAAAPLRLLTIDLADVASAQHENEVRRLAREQALGPFDLATGPLLRLALVRLTDSHHVLLLNMHHIIADGWSQEILMHELSIVYDAFRRGEGSPLEPLAIQYADYAIWQRDELRRDALDAGLAWWSACLRDAPQVLDLPIDKPRPRTRSQRGADHRFHLPTKLTRGLRRLSRDREATLFMTLLAAFQVIVGRYARTSHVLVGAPAAGRGRPELEGIVGFFVNTLVFRGDLSGDPTFGELLSRVRDGALGAYAHQDVPFDRLVDELRADRDPSHTPLFQVMFTLQKNPMPALALDGLTIERLPVDRGTSKYELSLGITETGDELDGVVEYSVDLFEAATIERMSAHLIELLEAVAGDPGLRLSELPLPSASERAQLDRWNATDAPHSLDGGLHELFEAQAARTPDAIAVVSDGAELAYGELDRAANRLAHHIADLGASPESFVGICLEHCPRMIVAMLAVLKSGAAYVWLDPADARERIAFRISDLDVRIVVTEEPAASAVPTDHVTLVRIDSDAAAIECAEGGHPPVAGSGERLAYAIYTSGSTGSPKAVGIEHRAAVNLLHWIGETYENGELAGVLATSSPIFDCVLFEIFAPLSWGGTIVLASSVFHLPTMPDRDRVRLVSTVPSAMAELLRHAALPASVQTVNLVGESPGEDLLQRLREVATVGRVLNMYGPSECTTYASMASLGEPGAPPGSTIGRPVANTRILVLDPDLEPVPIGVAGELCITGAAVARGYLGRPEATGERFVSHPLATGPRGVLYRTGDGGRWRHDGTLQFLGRLDRQAKVRGFRIEPGEIEAQLIGHAAVTDVAVIARDDVPGGRLVAYVVSDDTAPAPGDLRAWLRERMPEYMIPSAFVALDALPSTANGKLDRDALPAPRDQAATAHDHDDRSFEDFVEWRVRSLWQEILETPDIPLGESFFDLGGNSLLAQVAVTRLSDAFSTEMPLGDFFDDPTVAGVARRLRELSSNSLEAVRGSVVPVAAGGSKPPLYCIYPGGGGVYKFGNFARIDPDRPIVGLMLPEYGGDSPAYSVAALASHYVAELRAWSSGPYHLLGLCGSGYVAWEMARLLEAGGDEVRFLGMIETMAPGGCSATSVAEQILAEPSLAFLEDDDDVTKAIRAIGDEDFTQAAVRRVMSGMSDAWQHVFRRARREGLLPPTLDFELFMRLVEGTASYAIAMRSYEPEAWDGPVRVFVGPGLGAAARSSWAALTGDDLVVSEIDVDTELVVSTPLARSVTASVDAADCRAPAGAASPVVDSVAW